MSGFDIPGAEDFPRARLIGSEQGLRETPRPSDDSRDFGSVLTDALQKVNQLGNETHDKAAELARGEAVEVHELMIAMGKSEVAFSLMLEVRNKMVEAWQKLSRSAI